MLSVGVETRTEDAACDPWRGFAAYMGAESLGGFTSLAFELDRQISRIQLSDKLHAFTRGTFQFR
jgi:hypothetical protein